MPCAKPQVLKLGPGSLTYRMSIYRMPRIAVPSFTQPKNALYSRLGNYFSEHFADGNRGIGTNCRDLLQGYIN